MASEHGSCRGTALAGLVPWLSARTRVGNQSPAGGASSAFRSIGPPPCPCRYWPIGRRQARRWGLSPQRRPSRLFAAPPRSGTDAGFDVNAATSPIGRWPNVPAAGCLPLALSSRRAGGDPDRQPDPLTTDSILLTRATPAGKTASCARFRAVAESSTRARAHELACPAPVGLGAGSRARTLRLSTAPAPDHLGYPPSAPPLPLVLA